MWCTKKLSNKDNSIFAIFVRHFFFHFFIVTNKFLKFSLPSFLTSIFSHQFISQTSLSFSACLAVSLLPQKHCCTALAPSSKCPRSKPTAKRHRADKANSTCVRWAWNIVHKEILNRIIDEETLDGNLAVECTIITIIAPTKNGKDFLCQFSKKFTHLSTSNPFAQYCG